MEETKKLAWIGITLTIISGWKELVTFANSILAGFEGVWNTFPPVIQLGLIIWLFWWMGNKK